MKLGLKKYIFATMFEETSKKTFFLANKIKK